MRNKLLFFSLVAMVGVTVLAVAAGVTVFALTNNAPVQTEQVSLDQPVEVVPVQIEPVKVANPIIKQEWSKYDGYAGYAGGDCPYSHSKAQLVEAPAQNQVVSDQLLTLAE